MNSLGDLFRVTSFGESHGSYVGCVIDGCPAGLTLDVLDIQKQVDKRKTNASDFSTTRAEEDQVNIISGIYENMTIGSPIGILIKNKDANSADYNALKDIYRPSHADYTYEKKYGIRDHRGGGRSSVRITAPLVAAGEIALQFIRQQFSISTQAFVTQIGDVSLPNRYDYGQVDFASIDNNEVRCPDEVVAQKMLARIQEIKSEGDTLGGIITCVVKGLPAGIGEPIFDKLSANLGHAMLSINTVKGFEYGNGFHAASLKGSKQNDLFENTQDGIRPTTNHSGGIQGGISNGVDIYFNVAFKPISSIKKTQHTVDKFGNEVDLAINGRHDVCAVPRAVPIVEAYTNIILADAILHYKINKL